MLESSTTFTRSIFRNAFVYAVSSAIRTGIPFLLLPVMTRYLSPSDYGIVATFQVILPITVLLIGVQTHGAVSVNYFRVNEKQFPSYVNSVILIISFSFITITAATWFAKTPLAGLLRFPDTWLIVAIIAALSQVVCTLVLTIWQVEQKPHFYGVFQVLQTAVDVSLSLFLVMLVGLQWKGRVLGIAVGYLFFGAIAILVIARRRYLTPSHNKTFIKDALLFGLPLLPDGLGKWVITGVDRILINSMVGVDATGIYAVGYQVGMIVHLVGSSFNSAWYPNLFEKLRQNDQRTKLNIVKFTYFYCVAIVAFALGLSLLSPLLLKYFVGKEFYGAYRYVIWIALAYAAVGMYLMVVNYIAYVKKTYVLSWITVSCGCLHLALNYFLIRQKGAIGAAQAMAISSFVSLILTWMMASRLYGMPWVKALKSIFKRRK